MDSAVQQRFSFLRFSPGECRYLKQQMLVMRAEQGKQQEQAAQTLQLRLSAIDDRIGRLTDAYIDRLIERHGERWFVELAATVGQYRYIATINNTFGVMPAEDADRLPM